MTDREQEKNPCYDGNGGKECLLHLGLASNQSCPTPCPRYIRYFGATGLQLDFVTIHGSSILDIYW